MRKRTFLIFLLLLVIRVDGLAQDINVLEDKVTSYLNTQMPRWKHRRAQPIQGSERTLTEFWSFSNRNVKIAIDPYKTSQDAQEAFRGFLKYQIEREDLKGFGDEAYCWGYALANVSLRRGKYLVYVSTYAEVDSDADARMLTKSQRIEREKSEMKRWSQEFARLVAGALTD